MPEKRELSLLCLASRLRDPNCQKESSQNPLFGNFGPFAEASLFRIEAKIVPLRVRFEPNLNSGVGMKDGQGQVSLGLL